MATYHLNIRHVSKAKGQSAKAKSDYITRDDKYSKRHEDLQFSSSGNMPSFANDNPKEFWENADIYERSNARVCTEIEFALPRELDLEQQKELVQSFINKTIDNDDRKLPYSYAIHNDPFNHNPHCHLIFSVRKMDGIERTPEQFFKRANSKQPELGGAIKDREIIKQEFLQGVRTTWRELANESLERYGYSARIDERTLAEQGIEREPNRRISRVEFKAEKKMESELYALNLNRIRVDMELKPLQMMAEVLNDSEKAPKTPVEQFSQKDEQSQGESLKTPENAQKPPKIANPDDVIQRFEQLKDQIKANYTMKEGVFEERQKKAFGFIPWGSEQVKIGEKNVWKQGTPQEIKDTYNQILKAQNDLIQGKITATQGEEVVKATKSVLAPKPTADELKKQRMAEFAENSRKARESLEKAQQKVQGQNRNQSQSRGIKF